MGYLSIFQTTAVRNYIGGINQKSRLKEKKKWKIW